MAVAEAETPISRTLEPPCYVWVRTVTKGWVEGVVVRWQLGWRGYQAPVVDVLGKTTTIARELVRKRDPELMGKDRP